MRRVVALPPRARTLGDASDAFLAQPDLAASSRRSYEQTLARLRTILGAERPLNLLGAAPLSAAMTDAWSGVAPATWNRHVATVRSFAAWCQRQGWVTDSMAVGLERRREPVDRSKAIPYAKLDRLWRGADVGLREQALWRLLYETAGRATEILSLNVEDVDLANRRAVVVSKGGATELLHFQAGAARRLPHLIAGRARGPLFLANRRPAPARYAGHSLRAGLATSAAAEGVPEHAIARQTGHKSLAVLHRYIRTGSLFRGNAAARVGL